MQMVGVHTYETDDLSISKHHLTRSDDVSQHFMLYLSFLGKLDGDDLWLVVMD